MIMDYALFFVDSTMKIVEKDILQDVSYIQKLHSLFVERLITAIFTAFWWPSDLAILWTFLQSRTVLAENSRSDVLILLFHFYIFIYNCLMMAISLLLILCLILNNKKSCTCEAGWTPSLKRDRTPIIIVADIYK